MPRNRKAQVARAASRTRLQFDPYLLRTKADAGSNTQIKTLQQPRSQVDLLMQVVQEARVSIKKKSLVLYYCFVLQLEYSLRISEVLSITPEDISYWGEIRIRAKKGGRDRLISSDTVREYVLKCKHLGINPFADLHKDYVYRSYKEAGLSFTLPGREKASVTHLFRHIMAESARTSGFGNDVITQKLGHKSAKTQEHYGQKKPK